LIEEAMNYTAINFVEKLSRFEGLWSPRVIAEMNDYQFKLVKIQGEFVWHDHPDTDEVFIVLEGSLDIEFRDGKVTLEAGEMFVVPKGIEHKPVAVDECKILLVEPKGVSNTGAVSSELSAENNVWV
jgi:mannose-6-phosphate isomerase-like protein (cupin superfamily)